MTKKILPKAIYVCVTAKEQAGVIQSESGFLRFWKKERIHKYGQKSASNCWK